MNKMIKINVLGKILEGDNEGWYLLVQKDFENTGGYLILISKDPDFASAEGCDYWVEKYHHLLEFFKESRWKIQWLEKNPS
jgi:hypothetical protein